MQAAAATCVLHHYTAQVNCIDVNPEHNVLYAGCGDGCLLEVSFKDSNQRILTGPHKKSITAIVRVRHDAVVTCALDGKVVLWNNGQPGRIVKRYDKPQHALALGVGDAGLMALGGADKTVRFWNCDRFNVVSERKRSSAITCLCGGQKGMFFSGEQSGSVIGMHSVSKKEVKYKRSCKPNGSPVTAIAYCSGPDVLIAGDTLGLIECWDSATGQHLKAFYADESSALPDSPPICSLAVAGSCMILASDVRGRLNLWHIGRGTNVAVLLPESCEGATPCCAVTLSDGLNTFVGLQNGSIYKISVEEKCTALTARRFLSAVSAPPAPTRVRTTPPSIVQPLPVNRPPKIKIPEEPHPPDEPLEPIIQEAIPNASPVLLPQEEDIPPPPSPLPQPVSLPEKKPKLRAASSLMVRVKSPLPWTCPEPLVSTVRSPTALTIERHKQSSWQHQRPKAKSPLPTVKARHLVSKTQEPLRKLDKRTVVSFGTSTEQRVTTKSRKSRKNDLDKHV